MSQSPQDLNKKPTDIFINYRRSDTSGHAGRLEQVLSKRFPGRVFMDIHTIEVGADFVDAINKEVGKCGVLIVLIGNQWLDMTDRKTGKRRLDSPDDFVAIENAEALKRNIRVIPVLVEDAKMPGAGELPPSLAGLVRRNAIEITDTRWDYDVEQLVKVLEKTCGSATRPVETSASTGARTEAETEAVGRRLWTAGKWGVAAIAIAIVSAVATVLVIIVVIILFALRQDTKTQSPPGNAANARTPEATKQSDTRSAAQWKAVVNLSSAEAEFVFPFDTTGEWEWYLDQSEVNRIEYEWDVYLKGEEPDSDAYIVTLYVAKEKGDVLRMGDFERLLSYATKGVRIKNAAEGNFGEPNQTLVEINPTVQPDGLTLSLTGEEVKRIFAEKPKKVVLVTSTPKQKAPSEHTVDVKYTPE
jgi:hypothetical protein